MLKTKSNRYQMQPCSKSEFSRVFPHGSDKPPYNVLRISLVSNQNSIHETLEFEMEDDWLKALAVKIMAYGKDQIPSWTKVG